MSKGVKIIGATILAFAATYFGSAFVAWNFDPQAWGTMGRYGSLTLLLIAAWWGLIALATFGKD